MAERVGFEPTVRLRAHLISSQARSTTPAPLRGGRSYRLPGTGETAEMEARNSGQIILFGSIAGTCPERNMSAYCASKAAVNMFAEILWKELENADIKVLLVCPAITNTPLMRFVTDENAPNTLKNSLAQGKLNDPEKVVDAIEKALTKEELICYPTPDAVYATRIRRFFPNYWWKLISKNS